MPDVHVKEKSSLVYYKSALDLTTVTGSWRPAYINDYTLPTKALNAIAFILVGDPK